MGNAIAPPVLTDAQRDQLSALAMSLELGPRTPIYREGTRAEHVFIIGSGIVKTFRDLPSGTRHVAAFWFARDLFGLADAGKYAYSTETVTAATLHRIPVDALTDALLGDGRLQFQFFLKVVHEFREAQRMRVALARRDAPGKVAAFIDMLDRQGAATEPDREIAVPMTRSDIAGFLGLSPEAVSRATRELVRRRLVAIPNRHTVRVLDRARFDRLVAKL
jgi:CRP/FNR family transcriptional regulator